MRWTVVIPMRSLPSAKSRLREATPGPEEHARLVDAIRADTLAAVAGANEVARIVLAVDYPYVSGEVVYETYIQQQPGLNAALTEAQRWAAEQWPEDAIAALVGDLPALRSADLDAALIIATKHDRAFVPDAMLIGTTMLTARPGIELQPIFGPQSGRLHSEIATTIPGAPGLSLDVDTPEDLEIALRLGVGPRTAAVLNRTPR